jgi:hypothetical protein
MYNQFKYVLHSIIALTTLVWSSHGSVTLNLDVGKLTTSASTGSNLVAADTLWVLVVDSDDDNSIWGTSLDSGISSATANSLLTDGQSIDLGTVINGDTVFAMGGVNESNGPGTLYSPLPGITYDDPGATGNGVDNGRAFAIAWFPGIIYTGASQIISGSNPHNIGNQVGLFNVTTNTDPAFLDAGMILPPDGIVDSRGAASESFGGTAPDSLFVAVDLVPEPSTTLYLAAAVFSFLLRRRR